MSDKNNLKNAIRLRAKSLGIEEIGFCRHEEKTAICCLFPYFHRDKGETNLSMYARGIDYHVMARKKLEELLSPFIKEFEIRVDTGPLDNIDVAYRAGLGVVGKNRLLINENLGSYFFIGYALADIDLTFDVPLKGSCLSCNKCLMICPGEALSDRGLAIEKCASHISQKKGELTPSEIKILKKSSLIFGCDICQDICPMNQKPLYAMKEFMHDRISCLKKEDLENLSNKEFKEKYGNYAFSWRGKAVLLRNMEILK